MLLRNSFCFRITKKFCFPSKCLPGVCVWCWASGLKADVKLDLLIRLDHGTKELMKLRHACADRNEASLKYLAKWDDIRHWNFCVGEWFRKVLYDKNQFSIMASMVVMRLDETQTIVKIGENFFLLQECRDCSLFWESGNGGAALLFYLPCESLPIAIILI